MILFFAVLGTVFSLLSCGLEDYKFIQAIPQADIEQNTLYDLINDEKFGVFNAATIKIPAAYEGSDLNNFHFVIFYRIYISDKSRDDLGFTDNGTTLYGDINSTLANDYNSFYRYIGSTFNDDMDRLFRNRDYKYLCLVNSTFGNVNIDTVLSGANVLGKKILIEFPLTAGSYPTMTIGSNVYYLYRSNDNGRYNADNPYRFFIYKQNFWSSKADTGNERIDSTMNADVADKNEIAEGDRFYAFAAMYIAAAAIDDETYSYIYSTPSLIHVFRLTPE